MKTLISVVFAAAFCTWALPTLAAPALIPFTTIQADPVGQRLGTSMIRNHADTEQTTGATVAFRKSIRLDQSPGKAILHLFADTRYILWVNGQYVDRGPARFQPNGPEYDSVDLNGKLKAGENLIALLVNGTFGRFPLLVHGGSRTGSIALSGVPSGTQAHLAYGANEVVLFIDDQDEDGLPDTWEQQNFGGLVCSGHTLKWPSAPGIVFKVKPNFTLDAAGWQVIGTVTGGAQNSATFADPDSLDRAFYRIEFAP